MRAKLTKRGVDAVAPASRDVLVWDTELKGFGLKVTPAGAKVYLIQYRMGGRGTPVRRYTIGRHGSPLTPDSARAEAGRLLGQVRNRIDPAKEKKRAAAA